MTRRAGARRAAGTRARAGAQVLTGAQQAECATGCASGSRRAGRGSRRADTAWTRGGRAAGAGRGSRGGRLGGLCASGVHSWARLGVLVHLTKFLAWFDSVFFPSHQMNTVHCKINFFEKKNIFFKFKNKIKSNKF